MTSTTYIIRKQFIEGTLKGLTIEERTTVAGFRPGRVYGGGWTGSRYLVLAVTAA